MTEISLYLLALALLLALDLTAFTARTSFLQVTHARLLGQRDEHQAAPARTLALLPRLLRLRASLNLVLVFTRFALASLAILFSTVQPIIYPHLAAAAALFVCGLVVFWLEWAVERLALNAPEVWAVRLTDFTRLMMALAAVLLSPLSLSPEDQAAADNAGQVTTDEVRILLAAGQEDGVFEQDERRMINSVIDLGDTVAREIMVPRIDMQALDVDTPLAVAIDSMLSAGHSRVPVYENTVDNTLGLLYAKDLLRAWRQDDKGGALRDLLRPAYFVPEAKKVDELMAEMQSRRVHMAVIVDEYGGVAGLVTLEDIVEEVLGEIQDEYDTGEEAPYQKTADGGYTFMGRVTIDDFNEIMHSDLESNEADTLGGYMYAHLGHVPTVGEPVQVERLLLTVEQVSARRIRRVHARWLEADDPNLNNDNDKDDNRADS